MKRKKRTIIRQLDTTLRKFRPLLRVQMPQKGWIRAIRDALGMSGRQLANRLNLTKQRVDQIENEELEGSATIKAMRRIADSLDCAFVYGFAPRSSLEEAVRNQAMEVAREQLSRASLTMTLEDQRLSDKENNRILADMVEELIDALPSTLWDH